ncbi:MAG: methyltransferase domain-containing protein [candidate division Zixibacteria bacterium]|nr:methyltransferase domain-containing protein [Candidatus Tariuqbacter arcticus]
MSVECPCCGWLGEEFLPAGIVPRPNALCPGCGLVERHRLLWLYLRERTDFFTAKLKVLHIGPEGFFEKAFSAMSNLDYISGDIKSSKAMRKVDITDISFGDHSFDVILCYHVLEHVQEDRKALRELYRVLKPNGWAILQSPVDQRLEKTYEDPTITTPEDRLKHFHQKDHVRIYGIDFKNRIEGAGFILKLGDFVQELGEETVKRFRLNINERIYYCTKSLEIPVVEAPSNGVFNFEG